MFGRWKKKKITRSLSKGDWVMIMNGEHSGDVGRIVEVLDTELGRRYHVVFKSGNPEGRYARERLYFVDGRNN